MLVILISESGSEKNIYFGPIYIKKDITRKNELIQHNETNLSPWFEKTIQFEISRLPTTIEK